MASATTVDSPDTEQSEPEDLDQLMTLVTLKDWIPFSALAVVILGALIWSIFGRIPITVEGRGALIYPQVAGGTSQVIQFEAPTTGRLIDLRVSRGSRVYKGMLLAVIDQPQLRKDLEAARAKLAEVQGAMDRGRPLTQRQIALRGDAAKNQRQALEAKISETARLAPLVRDKSMAGLRHQRATLARRLVDSRAMGAMVGRRFEAQKVLKKEGLISGQVLLEAEQNYLEGLHAISDLEAQQRDLDSREVEVQKTYLASQAEIRDLESQVKDLSSRDQAASIDDLRSEDSRVAEFKDAERRVTQLESELRSSTMAYCEFEGRILEISASVGQILEAGRAIGAIQVDQAAGGKDDASLQAVAYFVVGEGKRIEPGMEIQITPDSVKREEFGGIVGKVTAVSKFPVTAEGAVSLVSNQKVAEDLTSEGRQIEVLAKLERGPKEGTFVWSSSKGPEMRITAGTTATMRVRVEEKAPIWLVIPALRGKAGEPEAEGTIPEVEKHEP